MFLRILEILFPIFAIVLVGFIYGRRHRPEMSAANRFNMDVFMPALVFSAMAGKSTSLVQFAPLALAAALLLFACGLIAWYASPALGVARKTLTPPMMFNNSGNIGLPLALLTWGESAMPAAIILFMVENTLHFSLGAKMLDPKTQMLQLWRIPVVFAAIAGLIVASFNIQLWTPMLTGIKLLGEVSIPLLLFGLGVRMTTVSFGDWPISLGSAIVRPIVGMILAWGLAHLMGLSATHSAMLLVYGALPPAVLNYLFSERYGQEPERVAGIVMVGNLLAVVFLPLALAWGLH